jgi:GNAT superfamily N-acetyltransferase
MGRWFGSKSDDEPSGRSAGSGSGRPVEIRELSGRHDLKRFLHLPWRIYRNDPNWVPPLLVEVREFLDRRKHPFYLHGAASQLLALRDGEPVGRVLVSDDPNYNAAHGTNLGSFGMFESIDDAAVAGALLDAAADWLRARGRTQILGPIDYSTNYQCGLLVEGFDRPPRIMLPHNPPYYARLLEGWGLNKAKDLFGWWFVDHRNMLIRWSRKADWLARRGGVTVRPFERSDFENEVRRCYEVYGKAYEHNWGFVQLSEAEFGNFAKQLWRIAHPDHVLLAEADGKVVGFSITVPDMNEAIRSANGRLTTWGLPIGLARIWWGLRRIRTARMMVLVVLEGYRRKGVSELLILKTLDYGKNVLRYTGAELGWTLEDNELINRTIVAVGGQHYKTYRIYEKNLI